jgi:hypothetical protein
MSAMSNYLENELIDHIFRARSFTAPTVLAVGLFTAAPSDSGGGTEVTGGSYARASLNQSASNWEGTGGEVTATDSAGTGGATQNAVAITFPTPSANWGVITHFGIFDATSAGNLLFHGALTASKTVNNGDPAPSFAIGALDVTLA